MQNDLTHAELRHAEIAQKARDVCQTNHTATFVRDDPDYHYGSYCGQDEKGNWAVQIGIALGGKVHEITAFFPDIGKTFKDIYDYMTYSGWRLLWEKP